MKLIKLSLDELIQPSGKTMSFLDKEEGAEQVLLNATKSNKRYVDYYKYTLFPEIMRIASLIGKSADITSVEFARNVYLYQIDSGISKINADGQFDPPLIESVAKKNNIDLSKIISYWKQILGTNWIGNRWAGRRHVDKTETGSGMVYSWPVKSAQIVGDYTGAKPSDKYHASGHFGIDLGNVPKGTPIFPIGPGTVIGAGNFGKGGNGVKIDHGNGVTSYYAHMDSVNVKQGNKVNLNDIIGGVGATGNARGSVHLHFEVKVNGQNINPKDIIGKPIKTVKG